MIVEYIKLGMKKAHYESPADDGTFYGEIPGFEGVYANAPTLEECRDELESVLEDWILFSISRNMVLPILDSLSLEIKVTNA
jgi:predicted RNase H-like HicB family nuclease